jgi:purine nucleosidase
MLVFSGWPSQRDVMKIWIDTDIGSDVDDALALAYVLKHPDLELAGISTVFGDTELRTRIAQALLERSNATSVPIVSGLGLPITPGKKGVMFGHEGLGLLPDPDPPLRTTVELDREERIDALASALEAANPDSILAIGPLSNLGALAAMGVRLPPLTIMGGKFQDMMLPGMVERIHEWNWFCDPLAVQEVMAAKHDVLPRVVPAEITFRTKLLPGDVELLSRGDALAIALATLCEEWMRAQVERFGAKQGIVALHDPLAAATLVRDDLCPFESQCVEIDESAAVRINKGQPNIAVATDVDEAATRDHLMEVLC